MKKVVSSLFRDKKTKWRKLENAAKIFPATSNERDARVFRVVCELKEEVNSKILQEALDKTMETFSMFSCVLRKGVFWNYLEESEIKPIVKAEYRPPCKKIYYKDRKALLFEVLYYKNRINVEIFHALSDGTGAVQFMRTLVFNYLKIAHKEILASVAELGVNVSDREKTENGFSKYYENPEKKIHIPKYKAAKINGNKLEKNELKIIEGEISTSKLLKIARSYNTTITVFLAALLLCAISNDLSKRQKKNPVSLMIPVNLRNFFPTGSMRNFFWWIDMGYDFNKDSEEFDKVIEFVKEFFKKEITKERMAARVNPLIKWEKNILLRAIPLEIKQLVMMAIHLAGRGNTAIYSNVGKIDMPKECSKYIEMFDIFTSTPKMEMTTCSYEDKFVVTFASVHEDTSIIKNFFKGLTSLGLNVKISAI